MIPLLQSDDAINTHRDALGFGLSNATFANDHVSDMQRIHEDLYHKVRNGDIKGTRYLLGINDDDSLGQVQPIRVQQISDLKKNTLLMHAAWKNHTQLFIDLLKYSLKQFGEEETRAWLQQENESGNQCMHIASQKGNVEMLEEIRKLRIDLGQKQRQGMTCLHIAAQSDQPILLYYLRFLDLNERENDKSTPLHLACFHGSETCAGLLLSWGCQVNLRNIYGFTPLHTTAMSGYQRITKRLLIYNAKTRLKDKNGKTAYDLAIENDYYHISKMIKDYQEGNIKITNLCGNSNRPRINEKIRLQMNTFILLLLLNFVYQVFFTLGNNIYGYIQIISDVLVIVFFIWITLSDPGYQTQYNEESFYQIMLNNQKQLEICPECKTLKPPRTRHCDFCKRCVMVYDHHCPWINNCIGANNHLLFIIFLYVIWISITIQLITSTMFMDILFLDDAFDIVSSTDYSLSSFDVVFNNLKEFRNFCRISRGVKIECAIFEIVTLFIFLILLSCLMYMQHRNIFTNQTTYEKFSRNSRRRNQESLSELNENQSCTDSCLAMLCKNRKDKQYIFEESSSITTAIIS